MEIKKFVKRPVVVKAVQLSARNSIEVARWCSARVIQPGNEGVSFATLEIDTLEGKMEATSGDWIIRGIEGEFYPCKPYIFKKTYQELQE